VRPVLAAALLCVLWGSLVAWAQPQVPAVFYGTATVDGRPVPDGTEVRAYIDGKDCTQLGPTYRGTVTIGGVSAYSIAVLHEWQEPGCGAPGKIVRFTIGGEPANETGRWEFGAQELNLNAGSGPPLPLPTATPTPTPTATPRAEVTRLPTDDALPPPANSSAPVARESGERASREPRPFWVWFLAGGGVAVGGAAVLGWWAGRRKRDGLGP